MTEYDHISYLQDIATNLKEIAHTVNNPKFHRVSSLFGIEEFMSKGKKGGVHLLVKDVYSSRKGFNDGRVTERQYFTYFLLKYKGSNFDANETIKTELRSIERKIFAKYKKDYYNDIHEDITYGLQYLDLASFSAEDLTLIHTGYLGVMVTFSNEPIMDIRYDANDWLNG